MKNFENGGQLYGLGCVGEKSARTCVIYNSSGRDFFLKKASSRDSVSYNSNETKISTVVPTDVFARINI